MLDKLAGVASDDLDAYTRVKLDSSRQLALCGTTDVAYCYLGAAGGSDGELTYGRDPRNEHQIATAAAAITAGSLVYAAANGKVSATGGAGVVAVGVAETAASGDGDLISVRCCVDGGV